MHNTLENLGLADWEHIADPGNGGAIGVISKSLVLGLERGVIAGTETRTIGAPTSLGIELLISHVSGAGFQIAVSFERPILQAGDKNVLFADSDELDCARLVSVPDSVSATGFRWYLESKTGATSS